MNSLDRLTGFYWVARTGGYARAVRAFPYPITEPGVHQQVRRLETELGVRLFRRAGKDRMALTPHGAALFEVVAPFLDRLRGTVQALRGDVFGGTLRIGAAPLLVQELLPAWLRRLRRARPDIDVALTEMKAPDFEQLRIGTVDLLVEHVAESPPDVEVQTVSRMWGFLVLPSSHPVARRTRVDLRALPDLPFVAYNGDRSGRALQLRAVEALGGSARERYSADSTSSLLGFVAAGLGYSVVPALDPRGPRRRGIRAVRLRMAGAELGVHAAWLRGVAHPLVSAAMAVCRAG